MQDIIINLPSANVEARNYFRYSEPFCTNAVRVFRIVPERVALQIRGTKQFMTVSLPLAEVDQLIEALKAGRAEIVHNIKRRIR